MVRRQLKHLYLTIRDSIAAVNAYLSEQIDEVESYSCLVEDRSGSHFDELVVSKCFDDVQYLRFIDVCFGRWIVLGFVAILLWYGSAQMVKSLVAGIEAQSAGLMVAFVDYLNRVLTPIRDISQKMSVIQRALAAVTKIFGLVDRGTDGYDRYRIDQCIWKNSTAKCSFCLF